MDRLAFRVAVAELLAAPAPQLFLRNRFQFIILPVSELAAWYLALHSCISSIVRAAGAALAELRAATAPAPQLFLRNRFQFIILPVSELAAWYLAPHSSISSIVRAAEAAVAELRAAIAPAPQLFLRNWFQFIILPVSELASWYLALHSLISSIVRAAEAAV